MSLTVGAALIAARAALREVPGGAGDAAILLAHALGLPRERLLLATGELMGAGPQAALEALLARRAAREPVWRILGARVFYGRRFAIAPCVLDPRPETETLVEAALAGPFGRVLDLGTGSGCILLTLLAERPGARGLGTDISAPALTVAQQNARALGLEAQAAFWQSDWFAGVEGRFDLIVSNPPYIAAAEMAALAPEVRDWDPAIALTPGGDGLGAYRAIADGVARHLAPGGRCLLEIGPTQGAQVAALLAGAGLAHATILPDLDGRDRVVLATCP